MEINRDYYLQKLIDRKHNGQIKVSTIELADAVFFVSALCLFLSGERAAAPCTK